MFHFYILKGVFYFESNNEETLNRQRNSRCAVTIYRGGGQNIAYADSSNNTITVSDDSDTSDLDLVTTPSEDANNNTVTVRDVNLGYIYLHGGYAYSGYGNANNNILKVTNTIIAHIHGGHANFGDANYNLVNFYSGEVTEEIGAGYSNFGSVKYNILNIYDGEINGSIYGGRASYSGSGGSAIGNTLNIYGGKISGDVYGGWAPDGDCIGNVLNVYGSPDLSAATLYAGKASDTGESSDNHLNIRTSGITAKNISGFETLNFFIPDSATDGSEILLTLTDSKKTNLVSTTVNVKAIGSANVVPNADITLLKTDAGIDYNADTTFGKVLSQGVSVLYPVDIKPSDDGKSIIAKVTGEGVINPKLDIIDNVPVSNSVVSTIPDDIGGGFQEFDLNESESENESGGEDDSGDEQKELGSTDSPDNKGWNVFGNMGGGNMRFKGANGSYIDTTSQNIDLGFARSVNYTETDRTTIAPVIDYQNTNYNSYLADGTHGRGNSKYIGFGFVLRNMKRSGTYFEGSLKCGRVNTEFASSDLDDSGAFGTVTYETSAAVYSGHAKVGKYFRLNKNNLLNVYGFYHHTLQGSSNADLSSGEHYSFSSANSGRARLGYRLTTRVSRLSQIYTGLAYQFEYNTGVSAKYKEYSTPGKSYNGSSGMLELGWLVKPLKNTPWTVDVNATGWIGYQRGVKATAKLQKSF